MRCKLVENLQFDSHFEASRLRDYSDYTYFNYEKQAETIKNTNETNDLAQNLQLNKEAIISEINEDNVDGEEDASTNKSSTTVTNNSHAPLQSQSSISSTSPSITNSSQLNQPSIKALSHEHIEAISQLEEKEKLIEKSECELITVTRTIKGRFELTNKNIYFFDTFSSFYYEQTGENDSNEVLNSINHTNYNNNNSNAGFSCHDFDILNDFKIPLTQLKEVQIRRYNLRRSALEFFLIDESNYFINFDKKVFLRTNNKK